MLGALYPTKKALKAEIGKSLKYVETSMFGFEYNPNGTFAVVGPSPHKRIWFAEITMQDGRIAKVR